MADAPYYSAEKEVEDATDDDAAHQGRHTKLDSDRNHDRDKGETCALHYGQLRTDRAERDGLQQCGKTCKNHRHLDHVDHVGDIGAAKTETCCTGNNNGRRHVADKHGQYVLNAQRCCLDDARKIIRVAHLCRGHPGFTSGHEPLLGVLQVGERTPKPDPQGSTRQRERVSELSSELGQDAAAWASRRNKAMRSISASAARNSVSESF